MRFKGLLHESNTKYNAVMKISITQRYNLKEIRALICFWLKNCTMCNRAKSSTYMNHEDDETQTQNLLVLRGKQQCWPYKPVRQNNSGFCHRIKSSDFEPYRKITNYAIGKFTIFF